MDNMLYFKGTFDANLGKFNIKDLKAICRGLIPTTGDLKVVLEDLTLGGQQAVPVDPTFAS